VPGEFSFWRRDGPRQFRPGRDGCLMACHPGVTSPETHCLPAYRSRETVQKLLAVLQAENHVHFVNGGVRAFLDGDVVGPDTLDVHVPHTAGFRTAVAWPLGLTGESLVVLGVGGFLALQH